MKKNKIDNKKKELIHEVMGYSEEYISEELIPQTLKKMQRYLIENHCADSFRDIKNKNMIEIKGTDDNGFERMVGREIKEKYGMDIVEAADKFNTLYPIFKEGVIKYSSNLGRHYTHFKVTHQTNKTYGISIKEYKYYHDTFYLVYTVNIQDLSKYTPFYISNIEGKDVRTILFKELSSSAGYKDVFSEIEKHAISSIIGAEQDPENEMTVIICNTIAIFRSVNFLWEKYNNNREKFYDNEFFQIKNWRYNEQIIDDIEQQYYNDIENYIDNIINSTDTTIILQKNTIDRVINSIIQKKEIINFYAATGFVFSSGLKLLQESFDKIKERKGECTIVIGALINYLNNIKSDKIDRKTIKYLNNLLGKNKIKIFSYIDSFYHGKIYYLSDQNNSYVIIGSSNISKTAFHTNCEVDILNIIPKESEQDTAFHQWFENFINSCQQIEYLDENKFEDFERNRELDIFEKNNKNIIALSEIKKRINSLTDEETQFRFNIWMNHNPDLVLENISIEALKQYIMFVFSEKEIVVFESFEPQNAFYVFGCPKGIDDLISNISKLTKTQMVLSEWYVDRGNHIVNKDRLKQRIDRLFKNA